MERKLIKQYMRSIKASLSLAKKILWWGFNFWRYKKLGSLSYIDRPLRVNGANNIIIGKKVYIHYKSWIASVPLTDVSSPILIIGDESIIGNFNHIYATKKIIIGKNVLTADKVYISDNLHSYENPFIPIMKQKIKQNNEVIIGDGAWLGENVCVLGANIGRNCVIGANSVVTNNIIDYSIAVGAPAKIIKRFNFKTNNWERTNPDGSFINALR